MTHRQDRDIRFQMIDRMTDIFREAAGLHPGVTGPEAAEAAGIDFAVARRIWRAFGLADLDQGSTKAYDEIDVETFRALQALLDVGVALDDILAVARVYGQAFSRIAEAEQRVYRKQFIDPILDSPDPLASLEAIRSISGFMFTVLDTPIRNAHRRQMDIAIRQLVVSAAGAGTEPCAVGFVDLVGYSTLTTSLDAADLTALVSRFDELAVVGCLDAGARVVKLVGDAVLFVSPHASVVFEAARAVVDSAEQDALLPSARAGLDFGDVVPLEGDYFGHPVNVAARVISIARPGTVVGSSAFSGALGRSGTSRSLGLQDLKGVGQIEVFEL